MQVFISWSKPTGRQLGMVLHGWLPEVMHRLHPWISSEDISKGQRWGSEVGAKLEQMEDQGPAVIVPGWWCVVV